MDVSMKLSLGTFLVVCVLLNTEAFAGETWNGHPFSAKQVEFETVLPGKLASSQVYMSREGIRIDGISDPESAFDHVISIYRFQDDRTWLIDPVQKSYVVMDNTVSESDDEEYAGGVLAIHACEGFEQKQQLSTQTHQGREVEQWQCTNAIKKIQAIQLYDRQLGVVVHEDINGRVVELRDIKPGKQPVTLYQPPDGYRKMTIAEMFTGYVELPKYKE